MSPRKTRRCKACNGDIQMFDNLIGLELPAVLPAEPRAEPYAVIAAMPAETWFSKLVGMRPDPDILIGGAMLELHCVGTLVEALRD